MRLNAGFTMVELLVATGVVMLVLAGIGAGVTFSVRNTTFSKEKTLSVRYAQEAVEWLRNQRDVLGWTAFYEVVSADGIQFNYCLDTLPSNIDDFVAINAEDEPITSGNCDPVENTEYIRSVEVEVVSAEEIDVKATVGWMNGSEFKTTELNSVLKKWK